MSALTPEQVEAASDVRRNWILGDFPVDLYIYVYAHQQAKIDALVAERDAAIAKLTALEKQEPLGYAANGSIAHFLSGDNTHILVIRNPAPDYKEAVYSQPVPASPITREGCNYLAMQGTVCNKCGEVHK